MTTNLSSDMNIQQTFMNLGFSENEACVYLAALEMGIASSQDIAGKAGLKRTTIASVLESLVKKGTILKTQKQGKNRYLAESPENIVKRFEKYQHELESALPELMALHNAKEVKPRVLFFEGKSGIKKIYYDTIEERPAEILMWTTSEIFRMFPGFPEEYISLRRQKHIMAKRISPADEHWRERKNRDSEDISITRLLPVEEYRIPIEINIYNNKVAFMSYGDEVGLIVESKAIADAMRTIFQLFWKQIK